MINYSIFDTLLEPVFILNADQVILYCNQTAATIAGSSQRKLTRPGKKITEVFEFQSDLDFLDLTKINEPSPYKELRFKNQNGLNGIVQITIQKLNQQASNNSIEDCWLMFVRDVTLEEQLQNKYRSQLEQKEVVIEQLKQAQSELQKYSKNLESLVAERTAQITEMNQTMLALLNSLNQGFFIFDEAGNCLPVYSKACEVIFETPPANKKIWDVFKTPEGKIESLKKWMLTVFAEMLPFEDLAPLGPQNFSHSQSRQIKLEYFPLRNDDKKIKGVVVMATDITALKLAQAEAETEKQKAKQILHIVQNKNHIRRFNNEIETWIEVLQEQHNLKSPDLDLIKRALHTIKGNASLYSIKDLVETCHALEEKFSDTHEINPTTLIKNSIENIKLNYLQFKKQVSEVVGSQFISDEKYLDVLESDLTTVIECLNYWSRGHLLAYSLKEKYFSQKLHSLFEPFNQIIQQTADKLNKEVSSLIISGDNISVDNLNLSEIFSTMVHCFRNSVDHGLETPEIRLKKGKNQSGSIQVITKSITNNEKKYLSIQIIDDGAGISPLKIREKLLQNGINTKNESDEQVIQHIFDTSFSTKNEVTEISGRGVGLDAVKAAVEKQGGTVSVSSIEGQGTAFNFLIPVHFIADNSKKPQAA